MQTKANTQFHPTTTVATAPFASGEIEALAAINITNEISKTHH